MASKKKYLKFKKQCKADQLHTLYLITELILDFHQKDQKLYLYESLYIDQL